MKYRNSSVASAIALIASLCSATLSFGEVNVVELTAQQIADGYAAGEFSVVDVTQAFLDRIEQFEPNYNAFTSFTTDAIARGMLRDFPRPAASRD